MMICSRATIDSTKCLMLCAHPGRNTWCTDDACGIIDICTETEVKSVVDAIVAEGLHDLGYKYICLDVRCVRADACILGISPLCGTFIAGLLE